MRLIGTLADEIQARTLSDYLLTLQITSKLMPVPEGWQVWVHRDEQTRQALEEFAKYQANPNDPRFQDVGAKARALRKQAERTEREHYKKSFDVRYFWSARDFRRCPVAWTLIAISVAVSLISAFGRQSRFVEPLFIATYQVYPAAAVPEELLSEGSVVGDVWIRSSMLEDLKRGEVWRVLTPMFLHFNVLHLLFNMLWMYQLGCAIEIKRGSWNFLFLVFFAAIVSNVAQYQYTGNPRFGGMSGVDLALFGYVWMKGLYDPDLGLRLDRNTVMMMGFYLVASMALNLPFAHVAHLSGLAFGMVIALLPHLLGSFIPAGDEE